MSYISEKKEKGKGREGVKDWDKIWNKNIVNMYHLQRISLTRK